MLGKKIVHDDILSTHPVDRHMFPHSSAQNCGELVKKAARTGVST